MTSKKIRWITQTALLLAVLVVLQSLTKGFGQLVTGSCVNAVLALSGLLVGLGSGITIALCSPVLAYLLGIAPQILTVPAIMAGNALYVFLLTQIAGGKDAAPGAKVTGLAIASVGKFALLYLLVAKVICGVAAQPLLEAGTLKAPMIQALTATFSWPQLITALAGGAAALAVAPVLRKAIHT